jgi:hypothetical protein
MSAARLGSRASAVNRIPWRRIAAVVVGPIE